MSCPSLLLVGCSYPVRSVGCSSLVKLGEGGRERPPHTGEGDLFAGASRSRSVDHAASGDYSDASAGCRFVVHGVRVLRSIVELVHVRACLTVRGYPLGLFMHAGSPGANRGRTCFSRDPLTAG